MTRGCKEDCLGKVSSRFLLDKQQKFYTKLTSSYLFKQSYLGVVKPKKTQQ